MSTQKHTQGPWKTNYPLITAQGGMALTVAVVLSREDNEARTDSAAKTKGEAMANAQLIALAPDLLEALYDALPCVEESEEFDKPHSPKLSLKIRALLAKAEGVK
jgi:hypothetical protein